MTSFQQGSSKSRGMQRSCDVIWPRWSMKPVSSYTHCQSDFANALSRAPCYPARRERGDGMHDPHPALAAVVGPALLGLTLLASGPAPARADGVADFYRGR